MNFVSRVALRTLVLISLVIASCAENAPPTEPGTPGAQVQLPNEELGDQCERAATSELLALLNPIMTGGTGTAFGCACENGPCDAMQQDTQCVSDKSDEVHMYGLENAYCDPLRGFSCIADYTDLDNGHGCPPGMELVGVDECVPKSPAPRACSAAVPCPAGSFCDYEKGGFCNVECIPGEPGWECPSGQCGCNGRCTDGPLEQTGLDVEGSMPPIEAVGPISIRALDDATCQDPALAEEYALQKIQVRLSPPADGTEEVDRTVTAVASRGLMLAIDPATGNCLTLGGSDNYDGPTDGGSAHDGGPGGTDGGSTDGGSSDGGSGSDGGSSSDGGSGSDGGSSDGGSGSDGGSSDGGSGSDGGSSDGGSGSDGGSSDGGSGSDGGSSDGGSGSDGGSSDGGSGSDGGPGPGPDFELPLTYSQTCDIAFGPDSYVKTVLVLPSAVCAADVPSYDDEGELVDPEGRVRNGLAPWEVQFRVGSGAQVGTDTVFLELYDVEPDASWDQQNIVEGVYRGTITLTDSNTEAQAGNLVLHNPAYAPTTDSPCTCGYGDCENCVAPVPASTALRTSVPVYVVIEATGSGSDRTMRFYDPTFVLSPDGYFDVGASFTLDLATYQASLTTTTEADVSYLGAASDDVTVEDWMHALGTESTSLTEVTERPDNYGATNYTGPVVPNPVTPTSVRGHFVQRVALGSSRTGQLTWRFNLALDESDTPYAQTKSPMTKVTLTNATTDRGLTTIESIGALFAPATWLDLPGGLADQPEVVNANAVNYARLSTGLPRSIFPCGVAMRGSRTLNDSCELIPGTDQAATCSDLTDALGQEMAHLWWMSSNLQGGLDDCPDDRCTELRFGEALVAGQSVTLPADIDGSSPDFLCLCPVDSAAVDRQDVTDNLIYTSVFDSVPPLSSFEAIAARHAWACGQRFSYYAPARYRLSGDAHPALSTNGLGYCALSPSTPCSYSSNCPQPDSCVFEGISAISSAAIASGPQVLQTYSDGIDVDAFVGEPVVLPISGDISGFDGALVSVKSAAGFIHDQLPPELANTPVPSDVPYYYVNDAVQMGLFTGDRPTKSHLLARCLEELRMGVPSPSQYAKPMSEASTAQMLEDTFATAECIQTNTFLSSLYWHGQATDDLNARLFQHSLRKWLTVHSFIASEGSQQRELADVLEADFSENEADQQAQEVPDWDDMLEQMIAGWALLEHPFVVEQLETLPNLAVAQPDYRPHLGFTGDDAIPENRNHKQGVGLAVTIVETMESHIKLLDLYLHRAWMDAYAQCYDGSESSRQTAALELYGRSARALLTASALVARLQEKAASAGVEITWDGRLQNAQTNLTAAFNALNVTVSKLAACDNPLGITEDDLPLYFGDPQGVNARFFASSDYVLNVWAIPAAGAAEQSIEAARQAFLARRSSEIQQLLTEQQQEERLEALKTQAGRTLADLCGLADDPLAVWEEYDAGNLHLVDCFIVPSTERPQCATVLEKAIESTDYSELPECNSDGLVDSIQHERSWLCRLGMDNAAASTSQYAEDTFKHALELLAEATEIAQDTPMFNDADLATTEYEDYDAADLPVIRTLPQLTETDINGNEHFLGLKSAHPAQQKLASGQFSKEEIWVGWHTAILQRLMSQIGTAPQLIKDGESPPAVLPSWSVLDESDHESGCGDWFQLAGQDDRFSTDILSVLQAIHAAADSPTDSQWTYDTRAKAMYQALRNIPDGQYYTEWHGACHQSNNKACHTALAYILRGNSHNPPAIIEGVGRYNTFCDAYAEAEPIGKHGLLSIESVPPIQPEELSACLRGSLGSSMVNILQARQNARGSRIGMGALHKNYTAEGRYCLNIEHLQDKHADALKSLHEQARHIRELQRKHSVAGQIIGALLQIGQAVAGVFTGGSALGIIGSLTNAGPPEAQTRLNQQSSISGIVGSSLSMAGGASGLISSAISAGKDYDARLQKLYDDYAETELMLKNKKESLACWHGVLKTQNQITANVENVKSSLLGAVDASVRFTNLATAGYSTVSGTRAALERELERQGEVPSLAHHYWLDERVDVFKREMEWARRVAFLAMRAAEFELQQSFDLRADILEARNPYDLQAALLVLQQYQASRTINGRRPEDGTVVVSLRDDVLQLQDMLHGGVDLTATERLQKQLMDPARAYYSRTDGGNYEYLGQAIPFTLEPTGALAHRCAERVWSATATIQGDLLGVSTPGVPLFLMKQNSFSSQWCEGLGDGSGNQSASIKPSVNLFRPGAATSLPNETSAFVWAMLDAWVNVKRKDFYADAYHEGSSAEFAGRGLYGNYVLLFPYKGLLEYYDEDNDEGAGGQDGADGEDFPRYYFPENEECGHFLCNVEDILLRFDFISVDNGPDGGFRN